jgi:hypothetical protein
MVKMLWIGQSAGKESKLNTPEYDSPTSTAGTQSKTSCKRVSVLYNELAILESLSYSQACMETYKKFYHTIRIIEKR